MADTHYGDEWLVAQLERILAAVEATEDADEDDEEDACECSEVKVASSDADEAAEQSAVDETLSEAHRADRAWKPSPLGPLLPNEPMRDGLEGVMIGSDLDAARYDTLFRHEGYRV